ncbi:hypothetical protein Sste5346_005894 [Sporothrix stenoceras]|uniref:Uncharacterized protein n=1 Tax=Sporothrix stenoceras TaxID=5173 RepID=A0ABR3Z293_9PEZI
MMQKIYQIIQIVQTLSILISEIQALCVKSFFRFWFDILFYFAPQLNPFRFIDAYRAATKDKTFVFSCPKCQTGGQPSQSDNDGGGQTLPQVVAVEVKPPADSADAEAPVDGSEPLKADGLACPVACGFVE